MARFHFQIKLCLRLSILLLLLFYTHFQLNCKINVIEITRHSHSTFQYSKSTSEIIHLTAYTLQYRPILGKQKGLCVLIESDKYVVNKSCVLIVMLKFLYGMETQI